MTRPELIRWLMASVRGLSPELADDAVQEGAIEHFNRSGEWPDLEDCSQLKNLALSAARKVMRVERRETAKRYAR